MQRSVKSFLALILFFNTALLGMEPSANYIFNEAARNHLSQELLSELLKDHKSVLARPGEDPLAKRPGESKEDASFRMFWGLFVDKDNCIKKDINPEVMKLAYGILSSAISHNDVRTTKLILAIPSINVNAKTEVGHILLYDAAEEGADEIVRALLRVPDIDVNVQPEYQGIRLGLTPLHIAAEKGHTLVVKLLLNAPGINPNVQDPWRCTPLYHACDKNQPKVVKILLTKPEVDVNLPNQGKETPLHCAAFAGHKAVVHELLQDPRTNINAETEECRVRIEKDYEITFGKSTPLDCCIGNNSSEHLEIALMLIKEGAFVNVKLMQHYGKGALGHEYFKMGVHRNILAQYDTHELLGAQSLIAKLITGKVDDIDSFISQIPGHELPNMLIYAAACGQELIFDKLLKFMGTTVTKELLIKAFCSAVRGGHIALVKSLLHMLSYEERLVEKITKEHNLKRILNRILSSGKLDNQQQADYEQMHDLLFGTVLQETQAKEQQPSIFALVPSNIIPQLRVFYDLWIKRVGQS